MRTTTGTFVITRPAAALALVFIAVGGAGHAQQATPPVPQSSYPQSSPAYPSPQPSVPTYPGTTQAATPLGYPTTPYNPAMTVTPTATSGVGSTLRGVFAMTLGAVLMSTGSGVAAVLERITGSILGWFSHKPQPAQSPVPAASAAATSPGGTAYPAGTAGNPTSVVQSSAAPTPGAGSPGPITLYAGLAYEVHVVSADGSSANVDPATYLFHSGDKFLVYFRPSLPGQMQVDNVNASGKRTTIDTAQMAAGQLTTLGPYQFTGGVGDESLHFMLTACSTPQLLTRTRDIVNISVGAGSPPSLQLVPCGTTTRGDLQTRDIQKVAAEGSTYFALDPVATAEAASGQLAPREFTLVFHHR